MSGAVGFCPVAAGPGEAFTAFFNRGTSPCGAATALSNNLAALSNLPVGGCLAQTTRATCLGGYTAGTFLIPPGFACAWCANPATGVGTCLQFQGSNVMCPGGIGPETFFTPALPTASSSNTPSQTVSATATTATSTATNSRTQTPTGTATGTGTASQTSNPTTGFSAALVDAGLTQQGQAIVGGTVGAIGFAMIVGVIIVWRNSALTKKEVDERNAHAMIAHGP